MLLGRRPWEYFIINISWFWPVVKNKTDFIMQICDFINKLQERALRVAYNDFNSSFFEHLKIATESTLHIRNFKFLLTEVYKFLNGLFSPILNEVFQTNDCSCDLRNPIILASKHKSTIKYEIWY